MLITKREHIYYLSGFSGSAGALIVTDDALLLISDFRYVLQSAQEAPAWRFIRADEALPKTIRQVLGTLPLTAIGFEPDDLSVAWYRELGGDEPTPSIALRPVAGLIEALRLVKDAEELACIREAARITDLAYAHLTSMVKPGITERSLALKAEWAMRHHGAQGLAFDIIVATGDHGALPHAQPGERALQPGDLVVVDMGARYAHYCADMTRTFAVAEAPPIAQTIYRICAEAQQTGIAQVAAGMTGREADGIVRAVIEAAGYGDYFGHGTGHGVGLEIHEAPRLSRTYDGLLPAGATVTIEPGIYLPEVGGVRIEDLVLLTTTGVEVISAAPKPLDLPVLG
jgi:Xaa-Pro aminopeptidase